MDKLRSIIGKSFSDGFTHPSSTSSTSASSSVAVHDSTHPDGSTSAEGVKEKSSIGLSLQNAFKFDKGFKLNHNSLSKQIQIKEVEESPTLKIETNLYQMKSFAIKEFETYIKSIPFDVEYLIVDPSLFQVLNALLSVNDLKNISVQLYSVDDSLVGNSIYLLRNRLETIQTFSKWIKKQLINQSSVSNEGNEGNVGGSNFSLCLTPSRNLLIEKQLEYHGVVGTHSKIGELRSFISIPLNDSYFEMGLSHLLRDICVYNDYSSLVDVSRILSSWNVLHSDIYIGKSSLMIKNLLSTMKEKLQTFSQSNKEKIQWHDTVDQLIVLDRTLDLYSPFITSFSYDSMIDNLFGLDFGRLDLSKIEKNHSNTNATRVLLNSIDVVYEALKRKNISESNSILNTFAKDLRTMADKKNTLKDAKEIRSFVENDMPQIQRLKTQLSIHLDVCFSIKKITQDLVFRRWIEMELDLLLGISNDKFILDFISERIVNKDPLLNTLSLIILYNMIKQGYTDKKFFEIYKELIHTYGHEIMPFVHNLRRIGLFCLKEEFAKNIEEISIENYYTKPWIKMARLFQQESANDPLNLTYEYSGYTPLLLKWIDLSLQDPKKLKDRVGDNFEILNHQENIILPRKRKILIFIVGGITRAELNCIKALEEIYGHKIIVGSTATIRGSTLIESFK